MTRFLGIDGIMTENPGTLGNRWSYDRNFLKIPSTLMEYSQSLPQSSSDSKNDNKERADSCSIVSSVESWSSACLCVRVCGACLWCVSVVRVCGACLWCVPVVRVCGACLWSVRACVRACVHACVRACVCVCVCGQPENSLRP